MTIPTALSATVRERADKDKLPVDHNLRILADQFDAAVNAIPPDARRHVGCWARLRRAWSEYSGEPLV